MDKASLIFCIGSIGLSLLVATVAFPYAAMDIGIIVAAATARPAYEMGSVDVGADFGEVTVDELMTYYVENPPARRTDGAPAPKIRFGGC